VVSIAAAAPAFAACSTATAPVLSATATSSVVSGKTTWTVTVTLGNTGRPTTSLSVIATQGGGNGGATFSSAPTGWTLGTNKTSATSTAQIGCGSSLTSLTFVVVTSQNINAGHPTSLTFTASDGTHTSTATVSA
jgi:hypothetical protein